MVEQEMDEDAKKEAESLKRIQQNRAKTAAASQKPIAPPNPPKAPEDLEAKVDLPDLKTLQSFDFNGKPIYADAESKTFAYATQTTAGKGTMYSMDGKVYFLPDGADKPQLITAAKPLETITPKFNEYIKYIAAQRAEAAKVKTVPPAEPPKTEEPVKPEETSFEDVEDLEGKVKEDAKTQPPAPVAPAPAKGPEYKFVNGFWSAYVAVYEDGKKIGEYSAFGGKVTGPNAEKLAKPVLDQIRETYLNGMKGK